MAMPSVPRNEFYELVKNIDETLFKAISRIKPDEIDELALKPKFEERVGQYFNEFKEKFLDEKVSKAREAAISGMPEYIRSAREVSRYERKSNKISGLGFVVTVGGLVILGAGAIASANTKDLAYLGFGMICGFSGILAGFPALFYSGVFRPGRDPLTVYRGRLKNQIIDAYGK